MGLRYSCVTDVVIPTEHSSTDQLPVSNRYIVPPSTGIIPTEFLFKKHRKLLYSFQFSSSGVTEVLTDTILVVVVLADLTVVLTDLVVVVLTDPVAVVLTEVVVVVLVMV